MEFPTDTSDPCSNVALLPGGRYCLIFMTRGMVHLIDLGTETPPSHRTSLHGPLGVGSYLAAFNTEITPESIDFQTWGEDKRTIVVAMAQPPK